MQHSNLSVEITEWQKKKTHKNQENKKEKEKADFVMQFCSMRLKLHTIIFVSLSEDNLLPYDTFRVIFSVGA